MTDPPPTGYFRKHTALAHWLSAATSDSARAILEEDATRAARLELLHDLIGLPIIESTTFRGADLVDRTKSLKHYLAAADGPYAIRILSDGMVINRNRNLPAEQLVKWALAQEDLKGQVVEFSRHIPNEYSAIFVNADAGTIGEAVDGSLRVLTHGGPGSGAVMTFWYTSASSETDNSGLAFSQPVGNERIASFVASAFAHTDVTNVAALTQERLAEAGFASNTLGFLRGYFEVVGGPSGGIYFIDTNRALGKQFDSSLITGVAEAPGASVRPLHGTPASTGTAAGRAYVIVSADTAEPGSIPAGAVVVCEEPSPQLVEQLPSIGALVTDRGGVLAHASIVCRELGIPSVVGVGNATELVPHGALVEVDGTVGAVTIRNS